MRRSPRARHLLAAGAALAVSAAILPTLPAGATVADLPGTSDATASADSRARSTLLAPTQAQVDALAAVDRDDVHDHRPGQDLRVEPDAGIHLLVGHRRARLQLR